MFIITLFCSTCWATTSKWWPFRLTAPTSCSHWTMFLLLASSGHGRNIWITGISSTWVLYSTIPIFSLSSIEHFTLQCQSQTLWQGSKTQVFILSILRLSLHPKWLPAMSRMYSEIAPVRKMLNALHLKISYLRIIVRFSICVYQFWTSFCIQNSVFYHLHLICITLSKYHLIYILFDEKSDVLAVLSVVTSNVYVISRTSHTRTATGNHPKSFHKESRLNSSVSFRGSFKFSRY